MTEKPKVEIIPAVLAYSFKELQETLERLQGVTAHVQVDVVDGHFAKHKSWPYKDGEAFATIVQQEHGLPLWEEMDFEFDLMVDDPAAAAKDYVHAGASRIIVHASAKTARQALEQLVDLNEDSGAWSVAIGVALGALEGPDALEPFNDQFDFVQVMGIEHIGKQGEPLTEHAVYLIERLRHRYPQLPIQIDGGVRLENVKQLVAAGATRLVAGSAILKADDPKAAYNALYTEANAQ